MNRRLIYKLANLSLYLLAIIGVTSLISTPTFATNAGASGAVGGGCSSGCCVNATSNGATWVRIPYNSDNAISLKKLMSDNLSGYMEIRNDDGTYSYSDSTVSQCKKSGGYVYVLVTPIGCYDKFAGPVAMNIAKNIYDGFDGYTIPYVNGNSVLDVFNSAATNGKINGYTYSDDSHMSWFCGAQDETTTFQGHTTINVADGAKTVKSGWDKFNSDTYETDSASVKLTFTHKLKRTDNQNVATSVNWKLATADDGLSANKIGDNNDQIMNFAANERNGSTKDATTTTYTVKLDPGTTRTICQGINHELEVKVSADGSRTSNQPGTRGSSKACITIKRKGSDIHNDSSAETKTSFIGESSNINKSGAHTIYFYVGNNINQPRDNQVKGGATQNYGEGEGSTPGPDDTTAANNAICNNFSSLCRNHSEATSNNITIPDNANLVGAKICAASSSKNSVFKETRTRTKNITYVDAEGNSIEETITEPYDVYTYYWQFSDVSCSPIAKRPNFRVTGGAAYSAGKITTSKSSKIDSNNSASNGLTFGSWSEYLAIAGNDIKNFGSGATLRGGSQNDNLTNNSPLTIANDSSPIGHSGISSDSFVSSIKSRFPEAGTFGNIWVHYGDTVNIGGGSNPLIIPNDNNIHIVFANHINIYNATTTVNAWLIADDTLNTCADIADLKELSSNNCNNSLTINGIAYAKNIKLRRTSGALAGAQSADSAEIFNLSAGDYERAYTFASTQYKQPVEVYTQELAPRV